MRLPRMTAAVPMPQAEGPLALPPLATVADISTRSLAVFLAVAEHGSFRAASEVLFLESSTVSKIVTRLEAALGARLLTRSTRKVALTQAGWAVLGPARAIVAAMSDLATAAQERPGKQSV